MSAPTEVAAAKEMNIAPLITIVGFRLTVDTLYAIRRAPANVDAHSYATVEDVRTALQRSQHAFVCAGVPSAHEKEALRDLEVLFAAFARSRFLALFDTRSSDPVCLARLASSRSTEVLAFDRESAKASQAAAVLGRLTSEAVSAEIIKCAQLSVPDELMTIFRRAIKLANRHYTLEELAVASKMPQRTLRHYCATRGFITPQRLMVWSRLLHCAFLLEDKGRTVESIAEVLGFASPTALRNQLRDYSEFTATQLRARGPLETIARLFEVAALRGRQRSDAVSIAS